MMRAYTLKILQNLAKSDKPLEDKEIIAWVNEKVRVIDPVLLQEET
jgi:hypothetical protein